MKIALSMPQKPNRPENTANCVHFRARRSADPECAACFGDETPALSAYIFRTKHFPGKARINSRISKLSKALVS